MPLSLTGKPSRRNRKLAGIQRGQSEQAALQRYEAFRLRAAKWSYPEIAAKLGVAVTTAFRYVENFWLEIKPITEERADLVRAHELAKLDGLERVWLPVAMRLECSPSDDEGEDGTGQRPCDRMALAALDRVLHISERRAKLTGIDVRPSQPENSVITAETLASFIRHQLGHGPGMAGPVLELESGIEGMD